MHWSALALDHLSQRENPSFALDFVAWDPFSQKVNLVGMTALSHLLPTRPDLAPSLTKRLRECLGSQWNFKKLGKRQRPEVSDTSGTCTTY